jgi:hypothetical protein
MEPKILPISGSMFHYRGFFALVESRREPDHESPAGPSNIEGPALAGILKYNPQRIAPQRVG